jgi:hypothetical protein
MAKKAKKQATKQSNINLLSHPATTAMLNRVGSCNKPPIKWLQQGDGSWLECFLMPDCTYGNCHAVEDSEVPPELSNGE